MTKPFEIPALAATAGDAGRIRSLARPTLNARFRCIAPAPGEILTDGSGPKGVSADFLLDEPFNSGSSHSRSGGTHRPTPSMGYVIGRHGLAGHYGISTHDGLHLA
jgi:hypothetical protein